MMQFRNDRNADLFVFFNEHNQSVTFAVSSDETKAAKVDEDEFTTSLSRDEVIMLTRNLARHVGFELVEKNT